MTALATFARFWWDFLVGDDWTIALFVIIAVTTTFALAHHDYPAWWFLPAAVGVGLTTSLRRVTRPAR